MKWIAIMLLISAIAYQPTSGYKILGVFHTMAKSHSIVAQSLMKGLAEAGHEVTMLSPFPLAKPMKNYRDVEIQGIFEIMKETMKNLYDMNKMSVAESVSSVYSMGITISNFTLRHEVVQNFLRAGEQFDLVIMEVFINEAMLGFGHHFKAPVIGLSTFGASKWTNDMVGSPSPLSYVPHPFLSFTDHMSFVQRFGNTLMGFFDIFYMKYFYNPYQEEIYEKAFPNPKPSLEELKKNVALVLLNTHVSLNYPRPYVPNMIEVGGMHIKRTSAPLPENLKTFLDKSKHGVVYFSMGSNLKSSQLPVEKRDALLRVFSKLKQDVMWKWEDENLPGKPNNVLISSWFPQDDILAHPNVKLFITHGGLLSTTEATYYGVPVIGIPIFGDQELNMARTKNAGYGLTVSYQNLTETSISWALNEMLSNSKYSDNAKKVSKLYRDQPMNPLQTAIYWVEYVCRHKGARHLHSAGQDLNWFQYHNLDVFALIVFIDVFLIYVFYSLIKRCFKKEHKPTLTMKDGKVKKNIKVN